VRVRFDTAWLNLPTLLRAYWRDVHPLDGGGQFRDRGPSYRPVIFSRGTAQRDQARTSLASAARELGLKPSAIKVEIRELTQFWPAEPYHQNYAERNKVQYSYYRWSCGRDRRLDQVWGSRARGLLPWRLKT
jgi:peptide-methionine (S)-S-oxide reductase